MRWCLERCAANVTHFVKTHPIRLNFKFWLNLYSLMQLHDNESFDVQVSGFSVCFLRPFADF